MTTPLLVTDNPNSGSFEDFKRKSEELNDSALKDAEKRAEDLVVTNMNIPAEHLRIETAPTPDQMNRAVRRKREAFYRNNKKHHGTR